MSSNLRFTSALNEVSPYSYVPERIPRRRKRPSNRTRVRKPLGRYDDYSDSISIALDDTIKLPLPGNKSNPSPLLRRSFDQSWLRWKEREVLREKEARDAMALQDKEQRRMFGGEGDDDMSLCPKMLEVVKFLFGGDIDFDYIDPCS